MKKLLLVSCALWWGSVSAQETKEYKVKLGNNKDRKVSIQMDQSEIRIEGYDGDEVVVRGAGFQEPPERAKGLKPLYSPMDNTGIGLAVTQEGGNVKIEKANRKAVSYTIRVPRRVALLYEQINWQGGKIHITGMEGDLEVRTHNAAIELENVTGPIVANTTSGEVRVAYSALNQEKPSAISTVNGMIDVSLPASAKTNLRLRSIQGEMFTDFDLNLKGGRDGLSRVGGGQVISGTTNGGGVDIQLNTISSNIYIRKQK
ncbi:DUF4097 family beta strand repeat-containing protein [Larkinella soli]|uniref:DUF4097 family beta strand repeat-containing protein n=1 Tax=Larkinella soli TaxID=1770527 RepID=UPI000FFB5E02|nr:DUF4097 family beta strand repeat-containing protein [Larkinella soli]